MSSIVPMTAWKNGRFRARRGSRKLLFGCMYEDAAIELRSFQPAGRIFCIASAGCTAITLAAHHAVVAVDINPVQVAYVQQRLCGRGVQRGSAERILAFARSLAPLAGWNKRSVEAFLDLDDPNQQILYWRRHLDTRRFRAAFSFLFSRLVLRSVYSAAFLNGLPQNFGTVLRSRMERCFALHPIVGMRMRMPCLRETRALARTILRSGRLKFDALTRPIFLSASPLGASLDFRFQIFWMERTRHTRGDYSLRFNMLLHLGRR
jgi:Protein of unknown function (DUF3419)